MRTTLAIREDLYVAVRRRAFEERRTLGDVVNELLERGLAAASAAPAPRLGRFAGRILVAEDFDAPIEELDEAAGQPVEP